MVPWGPKLAHIVLGSSKTVHVLCFKKKKIEEEEKENQYFYDVQMIGN